MDFKIINWHAVNIIFRVIFFAIHNVGCKPLACRSGGQFAAFKFQPHSSNNKKCLFTTFSLRKNTQFYSYHIGDSKLEKSSTIKDLGILYDSQFNFKDHVDYLTASTKKVLGFICSNCRDFTDIRSLKSLYFMLVRSKLEYGALAWFPY